MAAHAEHGLFVGIEAQPAVLVLNKPLEQPTHFIVHTRMAAVRIMRQRAFQLFLIFLVVVMREDGGRQEIPLQHIAHFFHPPRICDAPVRADTDIAHGMQEFRPVGIDIRFNPRITPRSHIGCRAGEGVNAPECAVPVQVLAELSLINGQTANGLKAFNRGFENRQIGFIHFARIDPVLCVSKLGRQPDQHIIGRSIGRPKRARKGFIGKGHPVAAIFGKALLIKGGRPSGQVVKPGNIAPKLHRLQSAGQFGKIIVVNPRLYVLIADRGNPLTTVFKQIPPAIGLPGLTKTVRPL